MADQVDRPPIVTVRIGDGASPATIAAVIGALKGAP
jgi:hypothetical protein